jgi:hypothetical protein
MTRWERMSDPGKEDIAEALDRLRERGATGVVHIAGLEFDIQSRRGPAEKRTFNSPYVSIIGETEGVAADTPIITMADFGSYIYSESTYYAMTSQSTADYLISAAYPGKKLRPLIEAAEAHGLEWLIEYSPKGPNTRDVAVSPVAVLAVFGEYKTPEDLPEELIRGSKMDTISRAWLDFAQYLKKIAQVSE